jgi:hypothetical protein
MKPAVEVEVDYFQFKQACGASFPICLPKAPSTPFSFTFDNETGTHYVIDGDKQSIRFALSAKCLAADYFIPEGEIVLNLYEKELLKGINWFNGELFAWTSERLFRICGDKTIKSTFDLKVEKFLWGYFINEKSIVKKFDGDSIEDSDVIDFDVLEPDGLIFLKGDSVILNGIGINHLLKNPKTVKYISKDTFVIASNEEILLYDNGEFIEIGDPTSSYAEADSYFTFFLLPI